MQEKKIFDVIYRLLNFSIQYKKRVVHLNVIYSTGISSQDKILVIMLLHYKAFVSGTES